MAFWYSISFSFIVIFLKFNVFTQLIHLFNPLTMPTQFAHDLISDLLRKMGDKIVEIVEKCVDEALKRTDLDESEDGNILGF